MNTYTPSTNSGPITYITFRDGTRLSSARDVDDFNVKKRLRVSSEANFSDDVEIFGDLKVHGSTTIDMEGIPEVSKTYVDEQIADVFLLLGWDNTRKKWTYSDMPNTITTNLDARLHEINFEDYYTKSQTDARILSGDTKSLIYYDGVSNIYQGDNYETYDHPATVLSNGNHFIIPHSTSGLFIIQNSTYGVGKVLTSDANGHATWETPNTTSPTIESIVTSHGQSNIASLTIKDTVSQTFEFLPNKLQNDHEVSRLGDAVLKVNTGAFTLSTGTGTQISRPCGIRMTVDHDDGNLSLFGGAMLDTTNTATWTSAKSNLGNSIRLDKQGIHITHDQYLSTCLYGHIHILQKSTNTPTYNGNSHTIEPILQIGNETNGGSLTVHGGITANYIKLPTGAALNKVLTSSADGTASWQPTQAASLVTNFSDDVTMTNLTVSGTVTTQNLTVDDQFSVKPLGNNVTWIKDNPILYGYSTIFLTKNTSPNGELTRNVTHSFDVVAFNYAYIQIPADYNKTATFEFPIYLQHNYSYKWNYDTNHYDNQERWVHIVYSLKSCTIKLLDNDNGQLVSQYAYTDGGFSQLGKVSVTADRPDRSDVSTAKTGTMIYTYNLELDRIKVNLIPPLNHLQKTYLIQVELKVEYHQTGSDLYPGDYAADRNIRYNNMSISLGMYRHYSLNRRSNLYFDYEYIYSTDWTSETHPATFVDKIYFKDPVPPQKRTIIWTKRQYEIRFSVEIPESYETFENPHVINNLPMTDGQMTPVENYGIHYNSYEPVGDKIITTSPLYTPKLTVRDDILCTGVIKSLGFASRRGKTYKISNEINIDKVNTGNIQEDCHIFNFSWSAGLQVVETWVDQTLVLTTSANYSDHRVKVNIQDMESGFDTDKGGVLDKLCSINLFKYTRLPVGPSSEDSEGHIGFYAHELQSTFPEFKHLVFGEKDAIYKNGKPHYQTVNYNELTVLLMKSTQELQTQIYKCKKMNRKILTYIYTTITLLLLITLTLIYLKLFSSSSSCHLLCHPTVVDSPSCSPGTPLFLTFRPFLNTFCPLLQTGLPAESQLPSTPH